MTNQSPSNADENLDNRQSIAREQAEIKLLQDHHLELKAEIEELYEKINQLKAMLQTVGSGLVIAILIAIGISGWYAYRLLLQGELYEDNIEENQATVAELQGILEQLETRLGQQERQIEQLSQELPDTLTSLTDLTELTQSNQQDLEQLSDRLEQLETKQGDTNQSLESNNN